MSFAPAQGLGTPADAPLVTVVLEDGLLAERKLTAGTGISLVDGGANGNLTINNILPCASDHGVLSGLSDAADHDYALLVSGTRALTANWNAGSFKITAGSFAGASGTAAAPTFTFSAELTKGMYSGAASQLDWAVSGTRALSLIKSGANYKLCAKGNQSATVPDFCTIAGGLDTGMSTVQSAAANNDGIYLIRNSVAKMKIVDFPYSLTQHFFATGTAAIPGIAFSATQTTGLYYIATNNLGFSTAGAEKMRLLSGGALLLGTQSSIGGGLLEVSKNQGAATAVIVSNVNDEAAAKAMLSVQVSGTSAMQLQQLSNTNGTLFGSGVDDYSILVARTGGAGLYIVNEGAVDMRFATTSVTRLTLTAAGDITHAPGVQTSGSPTSYTLTQPAHTGLASATGAVLVNFDLSATIQFQVGPVAEQECFLIQAPTLGFTGASTVAEAGTLVVDRAPQEGDNATITNPYTVWVKAGMTKLGGPLMAALKSGVDQAGAGAAAGELYQDTNDDNTIKMGV